MFYNKWAMFKKKHEEKLQFIANQNVFQSVDSNNGNNLAS